MGPTVAEIYECIVDDVVTKSQDVFAEEGIDASVLHELRETWSRKLEHSGALGNNSYNNDAYEWTPAKSEREAVNAKHAAKTPLNAIPIRTKSPITDAAALRSRMAFGVPQKRVEAPYAARAFLSREAALWPPTNHQLYHFPGTGTVLTSMARQQPAHVISSSQATRPARSSTGIMDSRMLMNSTAYSGTPTTTPTQTQTPRPNPIRVIAGDNAFHLQQYTPLTTSPPPQVRLSGKRKGPDDSASLLSHTVSTKAARRRGADRKTSSLIPQRDGADDKPNPTLTNHLQPTEQEEPDLDDDSTLSDGDDEEELTESSNCLTAQYDKVSRIKNRWRCQLKHGIFHIDGRDYLFKSANGEFTF